MKQTPQQLAQKIIKIFIENEISIADQLKIIKSVKERLDFCRTTANEMKQQKLF